MNNSRTDVGVPSILLWALLSNLLSIGGILARSIITQFELKLLVVFSMVSLPLFCYTSTLLSLRLRRPGVHFGPVEFPSIWNRICLVAWGTLSVAATAERYIVVLLYMADAFNISSEGSCFAGIARAVSCLGLLEMWVISCTLSECWRPTLIISGDLSAPAYDKKDPIISLV
ncbi:hypothetical protein RSOLAG1IB_04425 [Rhizoctonia solani AG-1 IB]|uniref:Uncharacterized protein n=1 Tax=Thanatephorus cucumeris (strain AG1-IB / isolate 7/3/14) TaxID=1108050 RepID=A0A0B7FVG0_THACB|nr:hypothetical protein RSOLAG1IB_04425 [Rhizoctonia solani AG-1 IB]